MAEDMTPKYGSRLGDALALALDLHKGQARKRGSDEPDAPLIPYAAHLLEVCSLVMQMPMAEEDHYIAAVLHDAVEDQPKLPDGGSTAELISERFGATVRALVDTCTDDLPDPAAGRGPSSWEARKQAHIDHLKETSVPVDHLLVPLADKLANATAMAHDLSERGPVVWRRFNASPAKILWYYDEMTEVLRNRLGHSDPMVQRLAARVDAMRAAIPAS